MATKESKKTIAERRPSDKDLINDIFVKAQVVVGIIMAAIAGPIFANAMASDHTQSWWIGGTSFVTGSILVLAGLTSSRRRMQHLMSTTQAPTNEEETTTRKDSIREPTMPMLGALLVYKYQVITEGQLKRALERQKKMKRSHPMLGEVLLEMGLVTKEQLEEALEYQQLRAEG